MAKPVDGNSVANPRSTSFILPHRLPAIFDGCDLTRCAIFDCEYIVSFYVHGVRENVTSLTLVSQDQVGAKDSISIEWKGKRRICLWFTGAKLEGTAEANSFYAS